MDSHGNDCAETQASDREPPGQVVEQRLHLLAEGRPVDLGDHHLPRMAVGSVDAQQLPHHTVPEPGRAVHPGQQHERHRHTDGFVDRLSPSRNRR